MPTPPPLRFPGGLRPIAFLRQRAVDLKVDAALEEPLVVLLIARPPNIAQQTRGLARQIVNERPLTRLGELIDAEMDGASDLERALSKFGDWRQLEQSCRAYFTWISHSPYYTHPEAQRASPPPLSRTALNEWALAHGAAQFLQHNYVTLADVAEPSLLAALQTRRGEPPVVGDLAAPSPGDRARHPKLAEVARAWLWSRAIIERRASEHHRLRAQVWESPPRHPALQGLAAKVARLAQDIRSTLHPTATPSSSEGTLLLRDLKAVWSPRSRPSHPVTVELDGPADAALSVHCPCQSAFAATCPDRLAALEALLDLLHSDTEQAEALARELATPAWAKALRDLDQALAVRKRPQRLDTEQRRLAFRISIGAGSIVLVPFIQRILKKGGWSTGTRMSYYDSLESFEFPHKRAVLGLIQRRGSYYSHGYFRAPAEADEGSSFDALELLSGYPHLYLADDPHSPVVVRRGKAGLAVSREADGTFSLKPTVDGDLELGARLLDLAGKRRRQAVADRKNHACVLVELSAELEAILAAIARRKATFPAEAMGELMRRLEPLDKVAPVALAP